LEQQSSLYRVDAKSGIGRLIFTCEACPLWEQTFGLNPETSLRPPGSYKVVNWICGAPMAPL
jgi:hypothetical protein